MEVIEMEEWLIEQKAKYQEKYDRRYDAGLETDYALGHIHAYESVLKQLPTNAPSTDPIVEGGDSQDGETGEAEAEHEVKKCPRCEHDRDNFDSKDGGQTLTNDKGVEWDYTYCLKCKDNPEIEDNFTPKGAGVTEEAK
jgi:hypothetical protein